MKENNGGIKMKMMSAECIAKANENNEMKRREKSKYNRQNRRK
jgi:hypothetical protein